ncbi:MAG TPA: AMP-binding protein [Candidatus Binatia bacterium]
MSRVIAEHRLRSPVAQSYRQRGLWPGVTLGESWARTVRARGDAIALVDGDLELSFTELARGVAALAKGLSTLGVRAGDAVAYQLPNWWEAAATLLATVSLGAHAVPIVPILRGREVAVILRQTRPRVVVVPDEHRGVDYPAQTKGALAAVRHEAKLVVVRPTRALARDATPFAELLRTPPARDAVPRTAAATDTTTHAAPTDATTNAAPPSPAAVDPDALAVIIYTSGSTAEPKGAMHTHQTLTAELRSLVAAHGLSPSDRVLMPSPLTHVSGVIHGILAPALLGTSAVLEERWDPGRALRDVERHRVTYMIGAPTFLQEMLAHPDVGTRDLSSLRLFSCGGASVAPELMRAGRARIPGMVTKRSYGSSEFPTIATAGVEDALAHGLDTEGRALAGVEIRITDADGRELPPGREGEIRARGPDCFLGYVDAALDAESFDDDGFFRTGDLGVLDEGGLLRVTGRVKDIIVRKGEKISAREVEDLLLEHPAIAAAALIPLADPATGERACACVQPAAGAEPPTLEQVVAFLRARDLTPQKLPEQLEVVHEFPRTPSGKIHKRLLRETIERRVADRAER